MSKTTSLIIMIYAGIATVISVWLLIRFIKESAAVFREKGRKGAVSKTVQEILPIDSYDRGLDCYVLENGSLMDMLQIKTKDLITSSGDEVEFDCLKFAKLYKIYGGDIKLIALNFPCNTFEQQQYFKQKIETAGNEVFKHFLERKLDELVFLEKNTTTREFYLMFFAKNPDELERQRLSVLSVLFSGKDGLVTKITEEKKEQILYKLSNKNSMVS